MFPGHPLDNVALDDVIDNDPRSDIDEDENNDVFFKEEEEEEANESGNENEGVYKNIMDNVWSRLIDSIMTMQFLLGSVLFISSRCGYTYKQTLLKERSHGCSQESRNRAS